jgi:2-keto-4-pentenoate hydratase/2-oxohepta-3-ene-1,7-dioic acid hydratase in catechol pathway
MCGYTVGGQPIEGRQAMKLATFNHAGRRAVGVVEAPAGRVFDLTAADAALSDMLTLIEAGAEGLAHARALLAQQQGAAALWHDLAAVELLAPLPRPVQMRDAMSYATHIRQSGAGSRRLAALLAGDRAAAASVTPPPDIDPVYRARPIYYLTNRLSVRGPESVVQWPRYSRVADFELELAVVIGRTGRDIAPAAAGGHIFGYTIYNDFSARDMQIREMPGRLGPSKGKSFDGGNVLGPWIVTADEIPDPQALAVEVRVNGEVWARNTTADMLFAFPELIAFISQDETLHAGEVIGSGTVGNCTGLELGRFLRDGDVVELEIAGIGILRNRIAMPQGSAV